MEVSCNCCGKIFTKRKSYLKRLNFCCQECHYKFKKEYTEFYHQGKHGSYKERNTYKCVSCNNNIKMLESQAKCRKNIFCSKQCRFDYDSKAFIGEGNPNYQNKGQKNNCLNCEKLYIVYGKAKTKSKYCCAKCRDEHLKNTLYKTEAWKNRLIQNGIKSMRNQKNKFTKPERIVYEYLKNNNIDYIPQHIMYEKFSVDCFIPSLNIIIEVLGDYWHGNPKEYPYDKLTEKQKQNKQRDIFKKDFFEKEGYNIYMIWECDIYNNLNEIMMFLEK